MTSAAIDDARGSVPMSPLPTPPRSPTGSHAALEDPIDVAIRVARRADERGKAHAESIAELTADVADLKSAWGAPADPVRKTAATGMVRAVEELTTAIGDLRVELRAEKDARAGERTAELARIAAAREPRTWLFRLVVGTLIVMSLGALFTMLGAYLRGHWH